MLFFSLALSERLNLLQFSLALCRAGYLRLALSNGRFVPGHCPVVGSSGLEPPTSRLSGARSNLLSYEPTAR